MEEYTLTTHDNPWNPYTHYLEWLREDQRLGYFTSQLLAHLSVIDEEEMSEKLIEDEIKQTIDEIVDKYPLIYKKFYKNTALNQ